MSALSDALTAMKDRVAADFGELRRMLDEALGNDAADATRLQEVTARADQLQADIDAAIGEISAIDPDPANPAAPPPEGEPPPQ